jgi:hypothetical protein
MSKGGVVFYFISYGNTPNKNSIVLDKPQMPQTEDW